MFNEAQLNCSMTGLLFFELNRQSQKSGNFMDVVFNKTLLFSFSDIFGVLAPPALCCVLVDPYGRNIKKRAILL